MVQSRIKIALLILAFAFLFISVGFFYLWIKQEPVQSTEDLYQVSGKLKSYSFIIGKSGRSRTYEYDLWLENIHSKFRIPADFVHFFKESEFKRDLKPGNSIDIYISKNEFKNLADSTGHIVIFSIVSSEKVYLDSAQCIERHSSLFLPRDGTISGIIGFVFLIIYWIYSKRLRESSIGPMP
jgi:hypothetical protein